PGQGIVAQSERVDVTFLELISADPGQVQPSTQFAGEGGLARAGPAGYDNAFWSCGHTPFRGLDGRYEWLCNRYWSGSVSMLNESSSSLVSFSLGACEIRPTRTWGWPTAIADKS